jgi:hypothetical protein
MPVAPPTTAIILCPALERRLLGVGVGDVLDEVAGAELVEQLHLA